MTTKDEKQADKDAIERVLQLISDYRTKLEAITLVANDDDLDPVMVEGETSKGYYVQLMVNPKIPARIMLDFDYPVFRVLDEDAPQEMWNRMAITFGLDNVCAVDL